MNLIEMFLVNVMNLQPEQVRVLFDFVVFALFVTAFFVLVLSIVWSLSVPGALDRMSDRITDLDLERIKLEGELRKESQARQELEWKLDDLKREHADELDELRSDIKELVDAVQLKRGSLVSYRLERRYPLRDFRN